MTNYEMVVATLKGTGKPYAEAARKVFDLWKELRMAAVSEESYDNASAVRDRDIVDWLFMEASEALSRGFYKGSLVQDSDGRYYVVVGFDASSDVILHVYVQGVDGEVKSMHNGSLRKADVPNQILELVKGQLVKDLKAACPILKEVGE